MNTNTPARSSFSRILLGVGLVLAAVVGALGLETAIAGDADEPRTARITVENATAADLQNAVVRTARDGVGNSFYNTRGPDSPPKSAKVGEPDRNDPAVMRRRIAFRYANPEVVRFGRTTSASTAINLYREATRLIDNRHVSPTSHADRTYRGLRYLSLAVGTAEFQSAYGVRLNESQLYRFRQSLNGLAQRPVRSSSDALNVLYGAMNLANNQLRLPPQAVTLEFVHAAAESLDKYSTFIPQAARQGAEIESPVESADLRADDSTNTEQSADVEPAAKDDERPVRTNRRAVV